MSDYIQHFGIKGQKHGVQRFQNPDGTWTPEGKKRRAAREGYGKSDDVSSMSDDDLRTKINRMKLEEEYRQYLAKRHPKKERKVAEIVAKLSEKAALTIGNKAIDSIAEKMFKKSKPKAKPIDLESLTVDKLKAMNKEELDAVNAYADAFEKAAKINKKCDEISYNTSIDDAAAFNRGKKISDTYFDYLSGESATNDEKAYYEWLGKHALNSSST